MFEDLYEGQPPSRHLDVKWHGDDKWNLFDCEGHPMVLLFTGNSVEECDSWLITNRPDVDFVYIEKGQS